MVKKVRIILQESSEYGSLYLGGTAMIAADMISFIKSDLNYFSVGVLFLFILTLGTVFRRVRWVLLPLTCSGLVGLFYSRFFGLVGLASNRSFFQFHSSSFNSNHFANNSFNSQISRDCQQRKGS